MKKLLVICLTILMLLSLVACGGSDDDGGTSTPNLPKETELVVGNENEVENKSSFKLYKIHTTKKVEATMADGLYYENSNAGQTYVDVVLDYTNTRTTSINSEDIATLKATTDSNETYNASLFAVETDNYSYVTSWEEIQPLTTARLHCAVSVPETTQTVKLQLVIDGESYFYDYTLSKDVKKDTPISIGQMIGDENYATVTLKDVEFTKKLLPTKTSGAYSYYEVDSMENSYLAVKFEVTNYLESGRDVDSFVSVKAKFMNKYVYTGFVVAEDTDQKGFTSYDDISPLTTRNVYCLIEVPDTVLEKDYELQIAFNTQEYTYKK